MKNKLATLVVLASVASFAVAAPTHARHQDGDMKMKMDMKMMDMSMTNMFKGVEVNGGTANLYKKDGKFHLSFSKDFKTPGSPSPHWQVVDGEGNTPETRPTGTSNFRSTFTRLRKSKFGARLPKSCWERHPLTRRSS